MATKKGISMVLMLLFLLVFLVIFFVIVVPFMHTSAQKVQDATESTAFAKAREASLILTEDLPDLKLEEVRLGRSAASCTNGIVQMHFVISNRGESAASVESPGIGVCSDSASTIYYVTEQNIGGSTQFLYDTQNPYSADLGFYKFPPLADLQASERITFNDIFEASVFAKDASGNQNHDCPDSFLFKPYICTDSLEEINDENNYLYVGGAVKSISCYITIGNSCTERKRQGQATCEYRCDLA